jgi:starch synthase
VMLMGLVSRMADQKGIDLILHSLPRWIKLPIQWVVLGSGDKTYEKLLLELAQRHPQQIGVRIGYDETLAHRIEAGADVFLMPSRFEPCGLNQMYSQRYGTLPIVSPVGGLYDTVTDANADSLADKSATGFVMDAVTIPALTLTIERAYLLFSSNNSGWSDMQRTAMQRDFSWTHSALEYTELYAQAWTDTD